MLVVRIHLNWFDLAVPISALFLACGSTPRTQAATPGAPTVEPAATPAAIATGSPEPSTTAPSSAPEIRSAVAAADRSPEDRALDAGRHPAELLEFAGVLPGQRVAELQAGGGYTAELLARVVGPTGHVYGHNTRFVLERFAEKPWSERLKKPVMSNVTRVDRELEAPFLPSVEPLDAVFLVLFYHDTVWQKVDRAKMNAAIFEALRPGGVFVLVDHSARVGAGLQDVETLHRIEESVVKDEVQLAGFRLAAEADFLREPTDTRDWNASPRSAGERRGTSDRFVLKFVKP